MQQDGKTFEKRRAEYLAQFGAAQTAAYDRYLEAMAYRREIATGIKAIDDCLGGPLFPGLYTIHGRPGTGKTTLALQIADNIAEAGQDVLYYSFCESEFDLFAKLLSRKTWDIDPARAAETSAIRRGKTAGRQAETLATAYRALQREGRGAFCVIDVEGPIQSAGSIGEAIRRHETATGKTPVVFLDFVYTSEPGDAGNVAYDLKRLAHRRNIPLFAVCTRESLDIIAPLADVSFCLFPGQRGRDQGGAGTLPIEIDVSKNTFGETGPIPGGLVFRPAFGRFETPGDA